MRSSNYLCSVYPIADTLVENSEAWQLFQRFPKAGSHDGTNVVFADAIDNSTEAITLPEITEETTLNDVIAIAGSQLTQSKGFVCTKSTIDALFNSTVYKLFAGMYSDKDILNADAASVGINLDRRKSLENMKIDARNGVLSLL